MKNASRFVRLMSLWLTASLLLVSVGSRSVGTAAPKAKVEQTAKGAEKPAQAVVSELSPMAVTAPVVVEFAQDFFLLPPAAVFDFQTVRNLLPPAPVFPVRLPYFEVLFRHFIVANAP